VFKHYRTLTHYKVTENLALKELGELQEKIIQYLAKNPESHNQKIQKGINHAPDQYGSIHNATRTLERQGYIKFVKGLSEKKVEIKKYSLTGSGLIYTLMRHPDVISELGDVYVNEYPTITYFQTQYRCLGHDLAMKAFKLLLQSEVLSGDLTKAGLNALSIGVLNSQNFSSKEIERYLKCLPKGLPPQFREMILSYRQRINTINF
jgi:hypothetical protein